MDPLLFSTRRPGLLLLAMAALLAVGAAIALGIEAEGLKIVVVPVALAGGVLLLRDPFWPLFLLVIAIPTDGLFNEAFAGLPISPATAFALATLAAIALRLPFEPRAQRILPDDPTIRWLLAFGVAMAISTVMAERRLPAINDTSRLASMAMITLLVIRVIRTQRQLQILLLGLVAATLLSAVIVIVESKFDMVLVERPEDAFYDGMARSSGASAANPTTAALMQTFGVTLAMALVLNYARGRWLTVATAGIGSLGIVYSYARSAALTVALVGLMIAWHHRRSRLFPLGVALGLTAMIAMIPLIPETYWERLSTLNNFNTDPTLWRRLGYHIIGTDLLLHNPLFGIGPGNFPFAFLDDVYRWVPGRTYEPRLLHNMYLGVASETGLVGLFTFLGMIASAMIRLFLVTLKAPDGPQRAFAMAFLYGSLAYYISSTLTPAQYVKYTWLLVGLAVVQVRLMTPPRETDNQSPPP